MTTNLNSEKPDLFDALNIAIEIMTKEADNTALYTRTFEMMKGRPDVPRSVEIGHRQRMRVMAAIEQIKILRLKEASK